MITREVLLFVKVAETASFQQAAWQLGISPSQVSKRVAALEKELGVRLFHRTPRSISLTRAGETLFEHYRRICEIAEESRAAIGRLSNPGGKLRISMPTCLGSILLPKLHSEFAHRYPEIQLDAHTTDAFVDIVAGGYDVVVRMAQRLTDSALMSIRLATSPLVVAAAPSYLEQCGTPSEVTALASHRCLGLKKATPASARWQFTTPTGPVTVPVNLAAVIDSNLALVHAARCGLGLIYVPRAVIANELQQCTLQAVLTDFCKGLDSGIFAVYSGRTLSSSAAAFVEFVRSQLPQLERFDRWQAPAVTRDFGKASQRRE